MESSVKKFSDGHFIDLAIDAQEKDIGKKIIEILKHKYSINNLKPDIWVKSTTTEIPDKNDPSKIFIKNKIEKITKEQKDTMTDDELKEYKPLIPGDIIWYPCVGGFSNPQNTYHFGIYIGCGAVVHKQLQTTGAYGKNSLKETVFKPSKLDRIKLILPGGSPGGAIIITDIRTFKPSDVQGCEKNIYLLDPVEAQKILKQPYIEQDKMTIIFKAVESMVTEFSEYSLLNSHCQDFVLKILFNLRGSCRALSSIFQRSYPLNFTKLKEQSKNFSDKRIIEYDSD